MLSITSQWIRFANSTMQGSVWAAAGGVLSGVILWCLNIVQNRKHMSPTAIFVPVSVGLLFLCSIWETSIWMDRTSDMWQEAYGFALLYTCGGVVIASYSICLEFTQK